MHTPRRTLFTSQQFIVLQRNRAKAITTSPFLLSLLYRAENRRFTTLRCTKAGGTQPKLSAACFVVQSCLADANFVVFSNYYLIGTRQSGALFCYAGRYGCLPIYARIPPSTYSTWPLTKSLAELARNTAGPMRSSVLPQRLAGVLAQMKLSKG